MSRGLTFMITIIILLLVAATMVTANLVVDLLYGVLDPRLRSGGIRTEGR